MYQMENLLFTFNDMSEKDKASKLVAKYFAKAGADVVQQSASPAIKKTSGIAYREMTLTFADSQQVVLRVKESGDIYQALLNKQVVPIKEQDNHAKAIAEIAKAMDAGRLKFQKKMAATLAKLPPMIKSAAPKMLEALTKTRDDLKTQIIAVNEQIDELRNAATRPA